MPVRTLLGALVVALGLSGCAQGSAPRSDEAPAPEAPNAARRSVEGHRVVTVGDIVCAPGSATSSSRCRHAETAALAQRLDPDAVIALGDLQYESGSLRAFQDAYDKSWGALKDITYAVPGNHEYRTKGASGYFQYLAGRPTGKRGYYSRMLGQWRLYALNSNCGFIDCAAQRRWLKRSLANRPARCTVFAMHHPRLSSGEHGSQHQMRPFVRIGFRHGVDLVLGGHDHHYERFRRSNADGAPAPKRGFVQFVSGAGGKSHYPAEAPLAGSMAVNDTDFGVLELTLGSGEYAYAFHTVDGKTYDRGVGTCV